MEFLLAAFGMPIFAAMAVIIESHLSNRTFKHPTTMVFYVSISNALFLPLLLFWERRPCRRPRCGAVI